MAHALDDDVLEPAADTAQRFSNLLHPLAHVHLTLLEAQFFHPLLGLSRRVLAVPIHHSVVLILARPKFHDHPRMSGLAVSVSHLAPLTDLVLHVRAAGSLRLLRDLLVQHRLRDQSRRNHAANALRQTDLLTKRIRRLHGLLALIPLGRARDQSGDPAHEVAALVLLLQLAVDFLVVGGHQKIPEDAANPPSAGPRADMIPPPPPPAPAPSPNAAAFLICWYWSHGPMPVAYQLFCACFMF